MHLFDELFPHGFKLPLQLSKLVDLSDVGLMEVPGNGCLVLEGPERDILNAILPKILLFEFAVLVLFLLDGRNHGPNAVVVDRHIRVFRRMFKLV